MLRCPRCETRLHIQRDLVPGCPTCGYEDYSTLRRMPLRSRGIMHDTLEESRGARSSRYDPPGNRWTARRRAAG